MAVLKELIEYLKKGFTLECATHETLTPTISPVDRQLIITYLKPETKERYFRPHDYTLSEVRGMTSIWEYGVLFLDASNKPYSITRIEAIEQAIQDGTPHTRYGELPK